MSVSRAAAEEIVRDAYRRRLKNDVAAVAPLFVADAVIHVPGSTTASAVAARAHVVEPQLFVLNHKAAGAGAYVARIPAARAPARVGDRRGAVGTREVEAVTRIGEVQGRRFGHTRFRG